MIKIVLVDSQEEHRRSLFTCLSCQKDFFLAGLGKDGYEAIRLVEMYKPDIALLELELPLINGIKAAFLLKHRAPSTSVIILSSGGNHRNILRAFSSCIAGYISKATSPELLNDAIRVVYHGGKLISSEIADQLSRSFTAGIFPGEPRKAIVPISISYTELEIMGRIGRGLSNREIAEQLSLREGTVRNYISALLQKIGLHDRTQIAIYALRHDLAD
jgi:DNA-binding NarL/FixJ family response regulator